ncbi:hypothetical protein NCS84_004453 [Salmonella enterica]|nr:hypothetical protein [Salmonella enterica]
MLFIILIPKTCKFSMKSIKHSITYKQINEKDKSVIDLGHMLMNKEKAVRELENLLSKVENQARILDELETAQWHYMDLVGITLSGLFDKSELKKERKEHSHLIKVSDELPFFEDNECAAFMSEQHNFPLNICAAYVYSHKW